VFRRCAAPEKIRIDRAEGNNSGERRTDEQQVTSRSQTNSDEFFMDPFSSV